MPIVRKIATFTEVNTMSFDQLLELHEAIGYIDDAEQFSYKKSKG